MDKHLWIDKSLKEALLNHISFQVPYFTKPKLNQKLNVFEHNVVWLFYRKLRMATIFLLHIGTGLKVRPSATALVFALRITLELPTNPAVLWKENTWTNGGLYAPKSWRTTAQSFATLTRGKMHWSGTLKATKKTRWRRKVGPWRSQRSMKSTLLFDLQLTIFHLTAKNLAAVSEISWRDTVAPRLAIACPTSIPCITRCT